LKDYRNLYLGDFEFNILTTEENNTQQSTTNAATLGAIKINGIDINLMLAAPKTENYQHITIQFDTQNTILAALTNEGNLLSYSESGMTLSGGFVDDNTIEFTIRQTTMSPDDQIRPSYILTRTIKGVRK